MNIRACLLVVLIGLQVGCVSAASTMTPESIGKVEFEERLAQIDALGRTIELAIDRYQESDPVRTSKLKQLHIRQRGLNRRLHIEGVFDSEEYSAIKRALGTMCPHS